MEQRWKLLNGRGEDRKQVFEPISPTWRLRLFGGCEITGPDGRVVLESAKTTALLAYLALREGPQSRASLCGLLWPELSEERAAGNLRRALWDQRRKLSIESRSLVFANRTTAHFDRSPAALVDALELSRRVDRRERSETLNSPLEEIGSLAVAAELYRGELLDGFFLDDAPEFEEWLVAVRERYRLLAVEALDRLTTLYAERADFRSALGYARRLVNLDPWREQSHRQVMALLADAGEPACALAQFETCRRILTEQLGTAPSRQTEELAAGIRATAREFRALVLPTGNMVTHRERRCAAPARRTTEAYREIRHRECNAAGTDAATLECQRISGREYSGMAAEPVVLSASPRLAPAPAAFIGRRREVEEILVRLTSTSCRLLTLHGPGGIGKTRLALQVAHKLSDPEPSGHSAFPDGVFVASTPASGLPGALDSALAQAVGERFPHKPSHEVAVLDFFRARRALIVLDGAEHWIDEVPLLSSLLAQAPELAILATSRVRLRLREEWVMETPGLSCSRPQPGEAHSDAVCLFLDTARRVAPAWHPGPSDLDVLSQICDTLEGSPLGIELAASWLRALPLDEIGRRVGSSLDSLDVRPAGAATPQGALEAVLARSFDQLSAEERGASERLSVFVGGFTREAAAEVAGVSLALLVALVDCSVVRLSTDGRYSMHELLRQAARARLARSPRSAARVEARRAAFFSRTLAAARRDRRSGREPAVLHIVSTEKENLLAAWRWAAQRRHEQSLLQVLPCLWSFFLLRGSCVEGIELFGAALSKLECRLTIDADSSLLALLRTARGSLRNRIGQHGAAEEDLRQAIEQALRIQREDLQALASLYLGETSYLQGRYGETNSLLAQSVAFAEANADLDLLTDSRCLLGRVALEEGRHEDARRELEAAFDSAQRLGDRATLTQVLTLLGHIDYFAGAFETARRHLDEALRLAREDGHSAAAAQATTGLAYIAEDNGDFEGARHGYQEVLAIAERSGDRRGIAYATMLIGETARRQGQHAEAVRLYERALGIATAIGSRYLEGLLLGNLAYVAASLGHRASACEHIRATLRAYRRSGARAVALPALVSRAEVALADDDVNRALELLGLVLAHPANRQDHTVEARRVLDLARARCSQDTISTRLAAGAALELETVVETLLSE